MPKRFFKATVAYNGKAYLGWQVQAEGRTVQAEMESVVEKITRESVRVVASGRTDSGVHALGQVVGFAIEREMDPATLLRALNGNLPTDIRVLDVDYAPQDFHAIRDAVKKRYRYFIQDGAVQDPFLLDRSWFVPQRLDEIAMREAATLLLGEHDFASYQSAGSVRATTHRIIHDFTVGRQAGQFCNPVVIEVEANGFLYNMVRNLVGTLVEVGLGKKPKDWPLSIIAGKDRKLAGQTAPAQGLFLVSVDYGK